MKKRRRGAVDLGHKRASFQISPDDFEQLLGGFCVQRVGVLLGIDEMCAHVGLDDYGHQTAHSPPHAGDQVHDLFAASLAIERPLNSLDLPPNAAYARKELLLFTDSMAHGAIYSIGGYPIQ